MLPTSANWPNITFGAHGRVPWTDQKTWTKIEVYKIVIVCMVHCFELDLTCVKDMPFDLVKLLLFWADDMPYGGRDQSWGCLAPITVTYITIASPTTTK